MDAKLLVKALGVSGTQGMENSGFGLSAAEGDAGASSRAVVDVLQDGSHVLIIVRGFAKRCSQHLTFENMSLALLFPGPVWAGGFSFDDKLTTIK